MWQTLVEPKLQIKGKLLIDIHMEEKLARMNLSIRASTSNNGYRLFKNLTEHGLDNLLNTNNSGQFLPPAIVVAVITYMNKIPQNPFKINLYKYTALGKCQAKYRE